MLKKYLSVIMSVKIMDFELCGITYVGFPVFNHNHVFKVLNINFFFLSPNILLKVYIHTFAYKGYLSFDCPRDMLKWCCDFVDVL